MKLAILVHRNLMRRKVRTVLTIASLVIAVFLLSVLLDFLPSRVLGVRLEMSFRLAELNLPSAFDLFLLSFISCGRAFTVLLRRMEAFVSV